MKHKHMFSLLDRSYTTAHVVFDNPLMRHSDADDLNINASSISRHLRGTLSHANGFKFAYAPEHDAQADD